MEENIPRRLGVSTRDQSVVGGREDQARPSALADPPKKSSRIPRMDQSKEARADTRPPRHTKEPKNIDVRTGDLHVHSQERHCQNSPHQLAPSVGTRNPPLQISNHASDSRRLSEGRCRRDTVPVKGALLRKTDHEERQKPIRTPERSPIKEYPRHYTDRQPQEDQRHQKKDFPLEPSTRREVGGSGNAGLQKQVDELRTLLKGITPGRGPVKHNTLLPFSSRLRKAMMHRGFRMPKFKTFSGFGDPSNHHKSFDSQLSCQDRL
ncbi:hypothetical protein LIER_10479 [Lithospermum erythrorhizon]|uniref:Uncharacterized protein n=1 Tax=Lithospermum erythrorhizon TaxID=34254 RepID=A0AAV3PM97_LITER